MMSGRRGKALHNRLVPASFALAVAVSAAFAVSDPVPIAIAQAQPAANAIQPGFRRLNEGQYVRSIHHIFGPEIKIPGRFAPPFREQGLLAIGDSHVSVTASGIEQDELRARQIAEQALALPAVRPACAAAGSAFDRACAAAFLSRYGRLLYRRPLGTAELDQVVRLSEGAAGITRDTARGLQAGLSRLLISPHFIFRVERAVPAPGNPAQLRLDDYALAARVSFLLWDAPPDEQLLDAAERGELGHRATLAAHVDRMIASPRFEEGVRAFFFDMFGYDQFAGLAKDQAIFPKFNSQLARDAQEQTLRTLVGHLVTERGDYRDIFTTRKTYMNRGLAALYKISVPAQAVEGWAPFTFPPEAPRAGILSLAGFLMLDPTHEGKSSPTIRGKSVRELLLCQPVPPPPPNVNFSIVEDDTNPLLKTARQRLIAHQENPACAGCHALTDPIGLSLEGYDGVGSFRTHERGAVIDASGTFDGKPYVGLLGLSQRLRESPDAPACLVQRVFEYGTGRATGPGDNAWLEAAIARFEADGFQLPNLMRRIATSDALRVLGPASPDEGAARAMTGQTHRRVK